MLQFSRRPSKALLASGWLLVTCFSLTSAHADKTVVLYSFAGGSDGARPYSSLVQDKQGNLYGTTKEGGAYFNYPNLLSGTIFEITN